jgi:tRNA (guanosine-2'-O-)-methyltransferase
MPTKQRVQKIERVLRFRQSDLTVVIENIHDPHNVSAILRTCDAVGILSVHLVYTVDTFPKLGKKSSASAVKWVKRKHFETIDDCYSHLRSEGYSIYATRIGEKIPSLYSLDLTGKSAFVMGNEHRGVSEEAAEKADILFQIPMYGMLQSLNVSVASAVTLFECLRQRLASGQYSTPKLGTEQLRQMIDEWSRK